MAVKPKLALIPSGVKAGKVYSVLPSDGVGDFDFSRSGNATRVNSEGLIETVSNNVPRLNYPLIDGVVSGCPSLLLEPQRTNIIPYSEQVNLMSLNSVSVVTDNTISPDGTLNANKVTPIGSGFKTVGNFLSVSSGSSYTISFFYKNIDHKNIGFYDNNTPNSEIQINLEDNSFILGSAITDGGIDYYGNGWYRAYTTFVANTNTIANNLIFRSDTNNGSYTADGSSIYAWGFQVELSSYPTSYIPSLTGSATTRSAETCNNSGDANTFNDSEGVLMAEVSGFSNTDASPKVFSLSDGGGSNRIICFLFNTEVVVNIQKLGETAIDLRTDLGDIETPLKMSVKYKANDFALWINGFEFATSSSGQTYSEGTLDRLNFDSGFGIENFYGNVKQIQYFDKALNDTDLETLTSWTSFNEMARDLLYTIQ